MEKKIKKREQKIKKVLTEEQYATWISNDCPGLQPIKADPPGEIDWESLMNQLPE